MPTTVPPLAGLRPLGDGLRPSTAPTPSLAGSSALGMRPGSSGLGGEAAGPHSLTTSMSLVLRSSGGLAAMSAAVLDKIPEPPQRRALTLTENMIVVRLKTEYNDLVLDAQKKELMLTKIAEEARSGAARLDEMHAGMIETVQLRARMREVEDDVARLVDQSHILGHVLSRIRDEYMHDQAEVDGIRNELEQAKKAQEVVAMRTIEAREKQFAAREQLATKRAEMDAAQATWVHELQSLRSMNVEEIQILKDFQFRKESRKKIPSEVEEELSSMAAARAVEGQMEAAERAKREEAVQMRAEIMQSTIDKLLAISGASSVEELVAFFEEKELRRHRTLATMSEREARLQALAADLQAKQSELQEIRFFASQGLSIDDNLRRQVELSESYEDKVSGYVLRTTKTVALTTSLLSGFVRSLAARLVASGFDLGGLRPIPERGSTPRARYEGAGGDGVAETMQNAAEERERQLERRRRAAIREAFEERRNAKPPADELPPAAVGPQRPDDLSKSVGESSPRRDAPATSSAAAMSPAPGASRRSSAQDHDQARASPGASGQHALAEESQEGLRGPMGASSRLPSLRQQWERDHDEAVHLLLEVEQKLDGPMGAMGMRGPSEVSFGQHRSAPKSRKKPAPVLETDSSMLSLGAGLDASTPGTATPDEGGPVGPGRSVKRMSSLSTLAIARQNLQVVMDVQEMLRSGRDTLPANNTRVNPAQQEQHERDKEIMNWLLEHQPALRRRLHESMMDTIATIKDLASTCCALGLECTVSELNRVFALPEMRSSGSSTGKFDMGEFLADSDNEDDRVMVSRVDIKSHTAKLLRTKGMGEAEKEAKDKRKKGGLAAGGTSAAGGGGTNAARSLASSARRPTVAGPIVPPPRSASVSAASRVGGSSRGGNSTRNG